MEVGLFLEFPRQIGTSESEAFEYSLELVELAEQLGIDSIWLAELPFEPAQTEVLLTKCYLCPTVRLTPLAQGNIRKLLIRWFQFV